MDLWAAGRRCWGKCFRKKTDQGRFSFPHSVHLVFSKGLSIGNIAVVSTQIKDTSRPGLEIELHCSEPDRVQCCNFRGNGTASPPHLPTLTHQHMESTWICNNNCSIWRITPDNFTAITIAITPNNFIILERAPNNFTTITIWRCGRADQCTYT